MRKSIVHRVNLKIFFIVTLVLSISFCTFFLTGCEKKKPGSVQVQIFHNEIEGKLVNGDTYIMKYDGEPKVFDIKIYSVGEKKYLTDQDMERKNLKSLIAILVNKDEQSNSSRIDINDPNSWPSEIGKYEIYIDFNSSLCRNQLDPNYYASPSMWFWLIIEEEI